MVTVEIKSEFITLGQFLKFAGIINNGSDAKWYISENVIIIDGVQNNQRGKKIYDQSIVEVENKKYLIKKV